MLSMSFSRGKQQPYQPGQTTLHKLSRSKLELFCQCQRCFWLEQRLQIKRPPTPPFLINIAVDTLFKNEFDSYRVKAEPHPLMRKFKVDAVPYDHPDLDKWRHTFTGIQHLDESTNLLIFGGVDDVWINALGELLIVDYKATAKKKPVVALGPKGGWHDAYRRQMEIYQWLFKQNGFTTSNTGYFVYANGISDKEEFANTVEFQTNVFPYHGDSAWVTDLLPDIKDCLESDEMPPNSSTCPYCDYTSQRLKLAIQALQKHKR